MDTHKLITLYANTLERYNFYHKEKFSKKTIECLEELLKKWYETRTITKNEEHILGVFENGFYSEK